MMDRRQFVVTGGATAIGAGLWSFDGVAQAQEAGYTAEFTFASDGTFVGTITEPDGTVNDLAGTHAERPPSGLHPWTGTDVVMTEPVVLTESVTVNSLDQCGHRLELAPGVVLSSRGNIVNDGDLVIDGTGDPAQTTAIRFVDVDEAAFVSSTAGHSGPVATDVGLWTVLTGHGHGRLLATGAPKVSWCRAATAIPAGATVIQADRPLDGWRVGDEVVVTPTKRDHYTPHRTTITQVLWDQVTLADPVPIERPTVDVFGTVYTAELLNLTRNVQIGGTPQGRAHTVFLHNTQPQHISHVEYSWLSPVHPVDEFNNPYTKFVLGRWGVHFHHGGAAVSGSTVVGCTAHDIGGHAFVPHEVDGVTFTDCVAHGVGLGAYWWDNYDARRLATGQAWPEVPREGDESHNVTYERCVASGVDTALDYNGAPVPADQHSGFAMGRGTGNRVVDCVAAGVVTDVRFNGGAYNWTSDDSGEWQTTGSVAHNSVKGFELWTNNHVDALTHDGVTAYNCDRVLRDGAYVTGFAWSDVDLVNGSFASVAGKKSHTPNPDVLRLRVDAGGRDACFAISNHHIDWETENLWVHVADSTFTGAAVACVVLRPGDRVIAHRYTFTNCTFSGNEFWWEPGCNANSLVTFTHQGQVLELRPDTYTGDTSAMTWSTAWNCWVLDIT